MKRLKLAEALLRRKELNDKVERLKPIKGDQILAMVVHRISVTDQLDEVRAQVPRVSMEQITAAYDHYSRALRLIDAAIQQANWTTEVEVDDVAVDSYVEREELKETKIPTVAQDRGR